MDRRHLPLTALRSFEAVGRHLSFTRAAESLGVTHGAVSRQVNSLEQLLGVRLFERGTRLAFTEEGRHLYTRVGPAMEALTSAVVALQQDHGRRVLTVNAPPTFTMRWLIPRLSTFQRRYRDVEVRLATGVGPPRELDPNEVDLVIRRLPTESARTGAVPFLSSTLLPVCAPELIERRPVHDLAGLAELPLMEAATRNVSWEEWFERAGGALPASTQFTRFEQMFFALEAALEGLGVALMPSALVVDDLAARRLVLAFHVPGVLDRAYHFLISSLSRRREIAEAFGLWLTEQGRESNAFGRSVIASLGERDGGCHSSST